MAGHALVAVFGLFHSLLARDWVKAKLLRVLPQAAERSTYVVQSSLCLALAMWQWQALPATIWQVEGAAAAATYRPSGLERGWSCGPHS